MVPWTLHLTSQDIYCVSAVLLAMRSFGDRVHAALFKPNLRAEHTAFSTWIFERYPLTWIRLLILAPSGLLSPPDSLTSSLCSLRTLSSFMALPQVGRASTPSPSMQTLCPLARRCSRWPSPASSPPASSSEGSLPGKPSLQVEVAPPWLGSHL